MYKNMETLGCPQNSIGAEYNEFHQNFLLKYFQTTSKLAINFTEFPGKFKKIKFDGIPRIPHNTK
jgi:hypothetical protein